jgi:alkylation response protein AidB-like acyl-CoA dehydrogenase
MIDILPTAEQSEFISNIANAITKATGGMALGPDTWRLLAGLGCIGMGLDESVGGAGFSIADEALLHQELGRQLVSPNVLAAALAARLAAEAGDAELARRIVGGSRRVAFASPLDGEISAAGLGGEFHLLTQANDGLVLCISPNGSALVEVQSFSRRDVVESTDETIELVRASGTARPVHWMADKDQSLWRRATLLIAAELTGIAQTTQNRAVEYAKIRKQFGKPIGSFQAIGHHCANMTLHCDAAASQLYFASIALRDQMPDADFQVAAACAYAMGAAFQNATLAIQIHGGFGFSADSGLHRFLKRAAMLRHLAGGERTQELAVFNASNNETCVHMKS